MVTARSVQSVRLGSPSHDFPPNPILLKSVLTTPIRSTSKNFQINPMTTRLMTLGRNSMPRNRAISGIGQHLLVVGESGKGVLAEAGDSEKAETQRENHRQTNKDQQAEQVWQQEEIGGNPFSFSLRQASL